ncbi:SH3 domain-containing protein [Streptomyces sp. LX-29]|uniref:SH3 domain-containing protein n=1 Tax=unclassified Streptomyces TaxID=2593676 RepID=UPI0021B4216A|nr:MULTISPECIES: SH3 domain-containing protein [unclassified Streptomyces]WFB08894.1 SH3 domain-containing protein [Streptomyces sp. LX-29]
MAVSVALSFGGVVAMAPTASAVNSSACRFNSPDVNVKVDSTGARLRSGPGKRYASKGVLTKGDSFRYWCRTGGMKDYDKSWSYGKILKRTKSGIPAGTRGWVYSRYLDM